LERKKHQNSNRIQTGPEQIQIVSANILHFLKITNMSSLTMQTPAPKTAKVSSANSLTPSQDAPGKPFQLIFASNWFYEYLFLYFCCSAI
jgi:hypothetical protein